MANKKDSDDISIVPSEQLLPNKLGFNSSSGASYFPRHFYTIDDFQPGRRKGYRKSIRRRRIYWNCNA